MAINVYMGSFDKDPDSTRRPEISALVRLEMDLKDSCSITAPVLSVFWAPQGKPYLYNYAYIPDFQRYYFIDRWEWALGTWVASLRVDTMATWRDYIGRSTQYVERGETNFDATPAWDGTIVDDLYPMKTRPIYHRISATGPQGQNPYTPFGKTAATGTYVVGIINKDPDAVGSTCYYAFTSQQFRAFADFLLGDSLLNLIGVPLAELSQQLTKVLFNPLQYIASVLFFPMDNIGYGTDVTSISYGYWSVPLAARRLELLSEPKGFEFYDVPRHPQSARGYYLRREPYSKYYINWRGVGMWQIPSALFYDNTTLHCFINVDLITGEYTLSLSAIESTSTAASAVDEKILQIGIPIPLAQVTTDFVGAAANIVGGVAQAFTGHPLSALASIGNAAAALLPHSEVIGHAGNLSISNFVPELLCEFHEVVEELPARIGKPVCAPKLISSLRGYIKCVNVDIDLPATSEETEDVKSRMEAGFIYAVD